MDSQCPLQRTINPTNKLLRGLPSLKGPYAPVDWDAFPATPYDAFGLWLADAIAISQNITSNPGSVPYEPHAMTVSTVDPDGFPDARVLILKNVDKRGWHFGAKADSPKGQQLLAAAAAAAENAGTSTGKGAPVALTFYWAPLGRQVRVRGHASPLPPAECAADFLERPLASRISALASSLQSSVMNDNGNSTLELDENTRQARAFLEEQPDYVPKNWLVFAADPVSVEFWQGATDRRHQRLRYTREASGSPGEVLWKRQWLWP